MTIEIIAELAQGYEGKPDLARLLVKGALVSGADAVKIQLVYADELCIPGYPYYDLFASLQMEEEVWKELVETVHAAGKKLYFDVYGEKSITLAAKLGADGVKISTTDFYNFPLIKQAFELFDNVFLSIGGVPVDELDALLKRYQLPAKLTLMHGFQAEPTLTEDNNLGRIETIRQRYTHLNVGFMDHAKGDEDDAFFLPLMALGAGVSCIEKHISLDYMLEIEDYVSALSVDRFCRFVGIIRKMESAYGSRELTLNDKEVAYKKRAGKITVAARDLAAGEKLDEACISLKRVSVEPVPDAISDAGKVLGKTLQAPVKTNAPIKPEMIQ